MHLSLRSILYDGASVYKRNWKIAFGTENSQNKVVKATENSKQSQEICHIKDKDTNHGKYQCGEQTDQNQNTSKIVNAIYHHIINEKVGEPVVYNNKHISKLKKYIQSVVKSEKQIEKLMKERFDKAEFSGAELGHFLLPVLKKVLTKELLGCQENCVLMLNRFCKALKSGKKDEIPICLFIQGLNLRSVKWMKKIKSYEAKAHIMAKVVKWLFTFILKLLKCEFYVSESQSSYHKLTFIRKSQWKRREDKAFNDLILNGTLEKLCSENKEIALKRKPARIRFLPKEVGVRPITYVKEDKKSHEMLVLRTFVTQLLQKNYKFAHTNVERLHRLWTNVCNKHKGNSKIHMVSLDISNAYGSILQDRLLKILIEEMEKALGSNNDILEFDKVKVFKNEKYTYKYYFRGLQENPYKGGIIVNTVKYTRKHILQSLECIIQCQTIQKKKNLFLIKKGISQGISVSTALCNLYLTHLCHAELKTLCGNTDDLLIRVADDFLYITPSEPRARAFLKKMQAGFKDYNIFINSSKTISTLTENQTKIPFLGFIFDSETFQVTIKHVSGRKVPFRNMIVINHKQNPVSFLEVKMKQVPAQKLKKLTLSNYYITDQVAAENVFTTSCLMASIFKAILSMLFVTVKTKTLVNIIHKSARFLAEKVIKLRGDIVQTVVKRKFVRWIVFQAFILCLETQPLKDTENVVPELVKLQREENIKPQWIERVGGKLFTRLPDEFYLGR